MPFMRAVGGFMPFMRAVGEVQSLPAPFTMADQRRREAGDLRVTRVEAVARSLSVSPHAHCSDYTQSYRHPGRPQVVAQWRVLSKPVFIDGH